MTLVSVELNIHQRLFQVNHGILRYIPVDTQKLAFGKSERANLETLGFDFNPEVLSERTQQYSLGNRWWEFGLPQAN